MKWYQRVQKERKRQGLTYDEIAAELGVSASAIGHYLNGRRNPDISQIVKIAKMLGKSVSELCEDDVYFVASESEKRAIDIFRKIPEDERATALDVMEAFCKRAKNND